MLLENCCYTKREMMALNMVKTGVFGEIVHCQGAYHHDIRYEICFGEENRHYRLRNYLNRNCENYPTHELGPIAKVLNINRGNRMVSLVSIASKAAGLQDYAMRKSGASDASSEFVHQILTIMNENDVVWQTCELGKVDQGGGGTIAMYVANMNMDVIDCGVPVLSMHSPFEVTAKGDIYMAYKAYLAFYMNR